ncbi:MAG: hypothetical protein HY881_16670 [Deltaproteobacteria bacterium]|nr:hypothetical protein [Deltaproteobacteria bacterium]
MSKRINISISDEMFKKLSELKNELEVSQTMENKKINRKISYVCQEALRKVIEVAEVSRIYRIEGIKDGEIAAQSLTQRDKEFIVKVFSGKQPFNKLSRLERVDELAAQYPDVYRQKFRDLMDGNIVLHDWVEMYDDEAEDRRGEMTWSYIEGCFEGVALAASKEMKGNGDI